MDLVIEGDPESLEWLRKTIEQEVGRDAELEPNYAVDAGAFREPIIISVIVALGGPVVIKAVRDIISRRYEHIETMRKLDIEAGRKPSRRLDLSIHDGTQKAPIELGQLA